MENNFNNGGFTQSDSFTSEQKVNALDTEEMQGSVQLLLADNVGEYVVIEFLIGNDRLVRKQGIVYSVGVSYVSLFDDVNNNYIVCDIYSIRFIYFYLPGQRPNRNYNGFNNNGGTCQNR